MILKILEDRVWVLREGLKEIHYAHYDDIEKKEVKRKICGCYEAMSLPDLIIEETLKVGGDADNQGMGRNCFSPAFIMNDDGKTIEKILNN